MPKGKVGKAGVGGLYLSCEQQKELGHVLKHTGRGRGRGSWMLLVDPISFYYWLLKVGLFWNGSPSRGSLDHRKTLRMWAIRWDILFSVNTTLEKHHDLVSGRVCPCCNVPIDLRMQYLLKKSVISLQCSHANGSPA